jgi:hypothetical protein
MLACDGLWKSFTMEESINFINSVLKVSASTCIFKVMLRLSWSLLRIKKKNTHTHTKTPNTHFSIDLRDSKKDSKR